MEIDFGCDLFEDIDDLFAEDFDNVGNKDDGSANSSANPSTSHQKSANFSTSHPISANPSASHQKSANPFTSYPVSANPSISHQKSANPFTSHQKSANPFTSHQISSNFSTSHQVSANPFTSHPVPANTSANRPVSANPSTSNDTSWRSEDATSSPHKCTALESLPGFDDAAGSTWIYPVNYPVREYQYNIVEKALFNNTLVSLPTGLGKTFIAAVVMYNFYRWYPNSKVVFAAPSRPLVAQQIHACYNIMGIPQDDTIQMTGKISPEKRVDEWLSKRVFFLTPQVLVRDIARETCPAKQIKCLVLDEAHHSTGNDAYCQIINCMKDLKHDFRILALSATPGTDIASIRKVLANLLISHVELRNEDSPDIQPYIHERTIDKIVVPLGNELENIKKRYLNILRLYVFRLLDLKVLRTRDESTLSKYQILRERENFRKCPPHNLQQSMYNKVEGTFALLVTLYHSYELLIQHGIKSFYSFLKGTLDANKGHYYAKSELKGNPIFQKLWQDLEQMLGYNKDKDSSNKDGDNNGCNNDSGPQSKLGIKSQFCPYIITHPKMAKLLDIVTQHHQKFTDKGESTRVIIFSQYRDSVLEIKEMLDHHQPLVKAMSFVGQARTGRSGAGFSQKEQLQVVANFREGGYNTLVATCVGEEGLDIGEVDLIVCYDAPKSPVRLTQRMGRTGRQREGRVVILVTEGQEEQKYNQSQLLKRRVNSELTNANRLNNFLYRNSPRMIPRGIQPVCLKLHMQVGNWKAKPIRGSKKGEKSGQGDKSAQGNTITGFLKSKTSPSASRSPTKSKMNTSLMNRDEWAWYRQNLRVPASEVKTLPKPSLVCLKKSINLESPVKNDENIINLGVYHPWQTTAQPTHFIGHSCRSQTLVQIAEFIGLQQGLDLDEDPYGEEFAPFLDMKYVDGAQKEIYVDDEDEPLFLREKSRKNINEGKKSPKKGSKKKEKASSSTKDTEYEEKTVKKATKKGKKAEKPTESEEKTVKNPKTKEKTVKKPAKKGKKKEKPVQSSLITHMFSQVSQKPRVREEKEDFVGGMKEDREEGKNDSSDDDVICLMDIDENAVNFDDKARNIDVFDDNADNFDDNLNLGPQISQKTSQTSQKAYRSSAVMSPNSHLGSDPCISVPSINKKSTGNFEEVFLRFPQSPYQILSPPTHPSDCSDIEEPGSPSEVYSFCRNWMKERKIWSDEEPDKVLNATNDSQKEQTKDFISASKYKIVDSYTNDKETDRNCQSIVENTIDLNGQKPAIVDLASGKLHQDNLTPEKINETESEQGNSISLATIDNLTPEKIYETVSEQQNSVSNPTDSPEEVVSPILTSTYRRPFRSNLPLCSSTPKINAKRLFRVDSPQIGTPNVSSIKDVNSPGLRPMEKAGKNLKDSNFKSVSTNLNAGKVTKNTDQYTKVTKNTDQYTKVTKNTDQYTKVTKNTDKCKVLPQSTSPPLLSQRSKIRSKLSKFAKRDSTPEPEESEGAKLNTNKCEKDTEKSPKISVIKSPRSKLDKFAKREEKDELVSDVAGFKSLKSTEKYKINANESQDLFEDDGDDIYKERDMFSSLVKKESISRNEKAVCNSPVKRDSGVDDSLRKRSDFIMSSKLIQKTNDTASLHRFKLASIEEVEKLVDTSERIQPCNVNTQQTKENVDDLIDDLFPDSDEDLLEYDTNDVKLKSRRALKATTGAAQNQHTNFDLNDDLFAELDEGPSKRDTIIQSQGPVNKIVTRVTGNERHLSDDLFAEYDESPSKRGNQIPLQINRKSCETGNSDLNDDLFPSSRESVIKRNYSIDLRGQLNKEMTHTTSNQHSDSNKNIIKRNTNLKSPGQSDLNLGTNVKSPRPSETQNETTTQLLGLTTIINLVNTESFVGYKSGMDFGADHSPKSKKSDEKRLSERLENSNSNSNSHNSQTSLAEHRLVPENVDICDENETQLTEEDLFIARLTKPKSPQKTENNETIEISPHQIPSYQSSSVAKIPQKTETDAGILQDQSLLFDLLEDDEFDKMTESILLDEESFSQGDKIDEEMKREGDKIKGVNNAGNSDIVNTDNEDKIKGEKSTGNVNSDIGTKDIKIDDDSMKLLEDDEFDRLSESILVDKIIKKDEIIVKNIGSVGESKGNSGYIKPNDSMMLLEDDELEKMSESILEDLEMDSEFIDGAKKSKIRENKGKFRSPGFEIEGRRFEDSKISLGYEDKSSIVFERKAIPTAGTLGGNKIGPGFERDKSSVLLEGKSPTEKYTQIQSPTEKHTHIQSPTEKHTHIQSPTEKHTHIQSPTEKHTHIQSPTEKHTQIQSTTEIQYKQSRKNLGVSHNKSPGLLNESAAREGNLNTSILPVSTQDETHAWQRRKRKLGQVIESDDEDDDRKNTSIISVSFNSDESFEVCGKGGTKKPVLVSSFEDDDDNDRKNTSMKNVSSNSDKSFNIYGKGGTKKPVLVSSFEDDDDNDRRNTSMKNVSSNSDKSFKIHGKGGTKKPNLITSFEDDDDNDEDDVKRNTSVKSISSNSDKSFNIYGKGGTKKPTLITSFEDYDNDRKNTSVKSISSNSDKSFKIYGKGGTKRPIMITSFEDEEEDDDFVQPLSKIKPILQRVVKKIGEAKKKIKKKKMKSGQCEFIEVEAEMSEGSGVSSDETDSDGEYDRSFVDDGTQLSQDPNVDMRAVYLKSMANTQEECHKFLNTYKPPRHRYDTHNESFENSEDSFVVDNSFVEYDTQYMGDSLLAEDPIMCQALLDKANTKLSKGKGPEKKGTRKRIIFADSSSDEEDTIKKIKRNDEDNKSQQKIPEKSNNEGRKLQQKIPEKSNDEMSKQKMPGKISGSYIIKNKAMENWRDVTENKYNEKYDQKLEYNDQSVNIKKSCEVKGKIISERDGKCIVIDDEGFFVASSKPSGSNISQMKQTNIRDITDKYDDSIKKQMKSCEVKGKIIKDGDSLCEMIDDDFVVASTSKASGSNISLKKQAISISPGIQSISVVKPIDPMENLSQESSGTFCSQETSPLSQNTTKEPGVILVDSGELNRCSSLVSQLRHRHNLLTALVPITPANFVISPHMAVTRISLTVFSNRQQLNVLLKLVRELLDGYERLVIIVESELKASEALRSPTANPSNYLHRITCACLQVDRLKLLYSSGHEETALLLSQLQHQEQMNGHIIPLHPNQITKHQHVINFYHSLPGITYVSAICLAHGFRSIAEFIKSSPEVIRDRGKISKERVDELRKHLNRTFRRDMLSKHINVD